MLKWLGRALVLVILLSQALHCEEGLLPAFQLESCNIALHRLAQPNTPFNKVGRRFAILGYESGTFEGWAYPLKLFRQFEFSFLIGSSTRPIPAREIVRYIDVTPAATTLTYSYQSFTVKATFITAIKEPFAMILLRVDSTEPLTVVCSFLPMLQPMWPAGLGGQSAYWNDELKAYQISEPTRQHTAFIGSPAAAGISYTPAHMLSDTPSEFKIMITDPLQAHNKYIPIYMLGSRGLRDSLKAMYKECSKRSQAIYQETVAHYRTLTEQTLQVTTPDNEFNLAYAWSKVCLDNLMVDNPDLGSGLIAGLGASGSSARPGFGWFFGGDAFMNSMAINSYGELTTTRQALAFAQKWQRKDGKMAHELTQAARYLDWFGHYPYGYIHGDTTPFFIVAMYDYFKASGDTLFLRSSQAALRRAFDWCLAMDANKDGLIDNNKAGLGSVEYGALTGLATDIYTGALSVAAYRDLEKMAQVLKDKSYEQKARKSFEKANESFDVKFWHPLNQTYANAFNDLGEQVLEVSPWISIPAILSIGDSAHNYLSLLRLCQADMTTDWGLRSLSNQSRYFEPLNYNYGAVWPFLTGFTALAQFNQGLIRQGFVNLKNLAGLTFDNNLGYISELYSGAQHIWPTEAVSQQGFSSMAVSLALVRGWLGFSIDGPRNLLCYEPKIVIGYESVALQHSRINISQSLKANADGSQTLQLSLTPEAGKPILGFIAPHLWALDRDLRVEKNGQAVAFTLRRHPQSLQPLLQLTLAEPTSVSFTYYPAPALPLFLPVQRIGEENSGIKLVKIRREGDKISVSGQGLSGKTYESACSETGKISATENVTVKRLANRFLWTVDDLNPGQFVDIKWVVE